VDGRIPAEMQREEPPRGQSRRRLLRL